MPNWNVENQRLVNSLGMYLRTTIGCGTGKTPTRVVAAIIATSLVSSIEDLARRQEAIQTLIR
jgi:hypothetical protein